MKKISYLIALMLFLFSFMLVGCEKTKGKDNEVVDMTRFPNYIEDYSKLEYKFSQGEMLNSKELVEPFWRGNVIYNETVMLIDDGTTISGKLLYKPLKVLSVRDFSWKTEYKEGVDYTIKDNNIIKLKDSKIPNLTQENLSGINIPAPYKKVDSIANVATDYVMMGENVIYTEGTLIYGHQVSVSYVYDVLKEDTSYYPTYDEKSTPKFMEKLKNKSDVNISVIGDSISEGCSSSGKFKREPFMPDFMQTSTKALADKYGAKVNLKNLSVGGMTSNWGTNQTQITNIINSNPDILFIHFGVNDCGSQMSSNMYSDNIQAIILQVRESLPECEFVCFNAFSPNMNAYDADRFEKYWSKIEDFSKENAGIKIIDLWKTSNNMLKTKKYMDVTGNGINHVNDYTSRLYAMSILSTFSK